MKKALAILMVLAAITGVAVADVADIAVSGFGKLTWGVNLDGAKPNGFKNSTEWDIKIPLLAKKTFTTKSEGDAYAEISIVDAQYNVNGDEVKTGFTGGDKEIDSVKAKLVFGNVYMTIHGAPDFSPNNAEIWAPIKNDDYFGDDKEGKAMRFEPGPAGNGTKIGYKTDMFDVGVKLGSSANWERAATAAVAQVWTFKTAAADIVVPASTTGKYFDIDLTSDLAGTTIAAGQPYFELTAATAAVPASRKSQYVVGFDATVMPSDMVTASATFNYAAWTAKTAVDDKGVKADGVMSAGFKVTAKPVADLDVLVALDAGNDYNAKTDKSKPAEQVWAYDSIVSAKYKSLVELGAYYASAGTAYAGHNKDAEEINDLAVYAKVMDGGLVPNLTASATVMAMGLLSDPKYAETFGGYKDPTAKMAFGVMAAYKYAMGDVNYVKPGFELFGQNMYKKDKGTDIATAGNVYVDYGLFSNTVVTAKYEAGATQDNKAAALIKTPSKTTKGTVTLACKVTY